MVTNNAKNDNTFVLIIVALVVLIFGVGIGYKVLVNKVTDQVIERIQKEYSPSPYGPGFDPDKIDIQKLKKSKCLVDKLFLISFKLCPIPSPSIRIKLNFQKITIKTINFQ